MGSLVIASRSFSKHPVLRKEVLKRYPDAKFNDKGLSLNGNSLIEFLDGYEKAITALEKIDDSILKHLPDLKVIGKYGVGLDMIDLHAMKRNGVNLGWTGGVNKRSVSELVISYSIALLHRTIFANAEVRKGKWYQVKGRQLSDCTVGIIGCGHVGKDLVELLQPFNCKILANDVLDFKDFYKKYEVTSVGLEELIRKSDIVTLHLPLDKSTRNILNSDKLSLLKDDAVLINLARGGLIDEVALKELLNNNKIAGAALDVFEVEPPVDPSFATMDNVLITPHIGGSTEEAILAMGMAAIEGLDNSKNPLDFL
ncbi:MAG: phosphoglycerate dehydrogenase [Candidatus Marinimicrobia bacterium]|nr:phosphoglycerate dehydrogenase [Candidatus Neomarinimicrobiota bacterium]